jgi:hypothetical protein
MSPCRDVPHKQFLAMLHAVATDPELEQLRRAPAAPVTQTSAELPSSRTSSQQQQQQQPQQLRNITNNTGRTLAPGPAPTPSGAAAAVGPLLTSGAISPKLDPAAADPSSRPRRESAQGLAKQPAQAGPRSSTPGQPQDAAPSARPVYYGKNPVYGQVGRGERAGGAAEW